MRGLEVVLSSALPIAELPRGTENLLVEKQWLIQDVLSWHGIDLVQAMGL